MSGVQKKRQFFLNIHCHFNLKRQNDRIWIAIEKGYCALKTPFLALIKALNSEQLKKRFWEIIQNELAQLFKSRGCQSTGADISLVCCQSAVLYHGQISMPDKQSSQNVSCQPKCKEHYTFVSECKRPPTGSLIIYFQISYITVMTVNVICGQKLGHL